jgi:hypothetical protein
MVLARRRPFRAWSVRWRPALVDGVGQDFTTAGYAHRIRAAIAGATGNGSDPASTASANTRGGTSGKLLARIAAKVPRLVLAWRHRRARQAADLLLLPEPERVWARATLAYYNRVGDPGV